MCIWIIRDSNGSIKVAGSRQLGNASIITAECIALRDGVLTVAYNGFSNLEIEGDFKVIIDCYNKKSNLPSSIILLMEDIWRLLEILIFSIVVIFMEKRMEQHIV